MTGLYVLRPAFPRLAAHRPLNRLSLPAHRNLVMSSSDWTTIPQHDSVPSYSVFAKPIEKSHLDGRQYRVIRLHNDLTALLVHDPHTENAAASLDVGVGHLSDPDDMPGLAHFCEHLLFMGTQQFPKENEYSEYLSKNNGSSNAYTSSSNTNYHFHVAPTALSGAIDRFAGFFHSPLFAPSCTSRELNAVDSEHKKNHQSDRWRIFQLNKTLTRSGHPWCKFGTGNRETLSLAGRQKKLERNLPTGNPNGHVDTTPSALPTPLSSRVPSPAPSSLSASSEIDPDGGSVGRETRRRLLEWWGDEYCASRMNLCVIGRESLDDLSNMVSRNFSPILKHLQDPFPIISDHPFGPDEMGTIVRVQTIMSFHAVEISFPLAWQPPLWKYKPGELLSHFLGHEGPGSLHSYLKDKGWITSLSAGPQALGRGFAMIKSTMYLTKEGFDNYRSAVLALFKYLSILRSSQIAPWYQSEVATMSRTHFEYAEKSAAESYAVFVAEKMSWPVPTEKVLSAPILTSEWKDGVGLQEVQDALKDIRIDTSRVVLMAKREEHERISGELQWQSEKWYGTGYTVDRWDNEFLEQAQASNDIQELYLPNKNDFIPTNFDVEKREVSEKAQSRPHLIHETEISQVWYKKDDQFWLPKAGVVIEIRSPLANDAPRAGVLTRLFSELVNDSLTEYTYDASLAGLAYNLGARGLGIAMFVKGYNDKLPDFTLRVVEALRNLQVRQDRLEVMKEKLKRQWENLFMSQSYQLSDYYARHVLSHGSWMVEEQLQEISGITVEAVEAHRTRLLANINIRVLALGNMYKDQAITLSKDVEHILRSKPLPLIPTDLSLILPEGCNYAWIASVPNPNELNSALSYYLHLGKLTDARQRVVGSLLVQMMSEPAFDALRTKEQLGYVVSCSRWDLLGDSQFGLRIVVQSERGPGYLEQRVEAFLDSMDQKIRNMDSGEFHDFKSGLQQRWREPAKNLAEELSRYWLQIDSGYLDFLRGCSDADLLESVEKQEVLDLFWERIHPTARRRAKLSIHLRSQKQRDHRVTVDAAVTGEQLDEAEQIPVLVEQCPTPDGDVDDELPVGVTRIEDLKVFKAALQISEAPTPLVEWNDLPTPNL